MRNLVPRRAQEPVTTAAPAAAAAADRRRRQRAPRGRPWRVLLLGAGDALAFLAFAAQGRQSHGESLDPTPVLSTAFPFALAWFLVAPWLGVYRRARTSGPRDMLARTELGWLAAYPLALGLRWIFSTDHQLPISFAAVILAANAVLLGVWRAAFALVEGLVPRRARPAGREWLEGAVGRRRPALV